MTEKKPYVSPLAVKKENEAGDPSLKEDVFSRNRDLSNRIYRVADAPLVKPKFEEPKDEDLPKAKKSKASIWDDDEEDD
jgi:hypothetical protein